MINRLFVRYVRGPNHPCKLRLVRWLSRHVFKRLLAPTESGVMVLDTQDLIQNALLQYGHFEPDTFTLHRKLLKSGSTYVDVGANVGTFSLLAAQCVGTAGKVLCVEPNPPIFSRLLQNIALNPFAANIQPYCCACSDGDGIARLQIPPLANSGLARLTDRAEKDTFMVATKRLSSLLAHAGFGEIDMLKIDVEGHEYPVLSELFASKILPRNIVFECLPDEFPGHRMLIPLMQTAGYKIKSLAGEPMDWANIVENNLWATLEP